VGLQQVLTNLVANALKFVARGRKPEIVLRAESRAGRVRLWVEDNGIGIDPRQHEAIFEIFRRLHGARDYAGTGVGLSLVRKGMTRMGGACGVESEPGRGSRFWLDFEPAMKPREIEVGPGVSAGKAAG
jgi:signal transduction histidine kinase